MQEKAALQDDFRKLGYSKEDEYFFKANQELIERRRSEMDLARAAKEAENQKSIHWMKCPKCGSKLETINLFQINVDQCTRCKGVYMDRGELETLLKSKKSETFLRRLEKVFATREGEPGIF